jgi:hypothetical protein
MSIRSADEVGYPRPMGLDEAGRAQAVPEHRAAADSFIASMAGGSSSRPATRC